MVENLPAGSALHRAHLGHAWVDRDYMVAELTDRVAYLFELTRAVNSEDDATFHAPQRIPRPGDEKRMAEEAKRVEAEKRSVLKLVDQLLPKG